MKKSDFLVAGALLLFMLSGCTSVKRFKSASYKGADGKLVEVELFHTRLSGEPAVIQEKNLWTLSANAQTRLIQILDERYPDNEQFMSMMAGSYGRGSYEELGYTRKDLRMVFTISKRRDYAMLDDPSARFSPADRIEYFKLSLEIPDSYRLRFHEWNRYMTEYGEIQIADISFSRNLDLDLEGLPAGINLGTGTSLGRNEKQSVSKRFLSLNGSISDRRVVLEAEGTREVDLTGNITADISLAFDGFPELVMIPVFIAGEDDRRILSDLKFQDILVPALSDAPDTLFADLSLSYIYRHVQSGWNTFAEWDDRVEYYSGKMEKRVTLFLKKDYMPHFYCIGTEQGGKKLLKLHRSPEQEYLLQFMHRQDAVGFLEWLENYARGQSGAMEIKGMKLVYEGRPFQAAEVLEHALRVLPAH